MVRSRFQEPSRCSSICCGFSRFFVVICSFPSAYSAYSAVGQQLFTTTPSWWGQRIESEWSADCADCADSERVDWVSIKA